MKSHVNTLLRIPKINMFAAVFEKQPFRKISKINSSSEATTRMHFSISLFDYYNEIL